MGGGRVVEIQGGRPVAVPGGAVGDRPGQNEAPLLLGLGDEGGYLGCLGTEGGLADGPDAQSGGRGKGLLGLGLVAKCLRLEYIDDETGARGGEGPGHGQDECIGQQSDPVARTRCCPGPPSASDREHHPSCERAGQGCGQGQEGAAGDELGAQTVDAQHGGAVDVVGHQQGE